MRNLFNKVLSKIYLMLNKKMNVDILGSRIDLDQLVDDYSILNHEFEPINDEKQFALEIESISYLSYNDTYAVELSFYNSYHDEDMSHGNVYYTEIVQRFTYADEENGIENLITDVIDRYSKMYDTLQRDWHLKSGKTEEYLYELLQRYEALEDNNEET